ncbi:hypothetical protein ATK17_3964 [Branchiibius hedensis]|uniref:Uncharacterized protein n=1 Tax=Branchiibius hedensis TaxID=672460 RepID=A0A2Y9BNG6_9MICO|nr:hypothetical protein [Branchiibius hedensis]PWJ22795.1 hypothetical protein ATK17_3964 [Branchiibius hedensis]SSA59144.1 hypothetical protein SAMN04489750_3964 [Branchiibius hedensis]
MSDELDLDAVKARLAAATPGPWEWIGDSFDDAEPFVCTHMTRWDEHGPDLVVAADHGKTVLRAEGADWSAMSGKHADGDLIANAPTDIAALVAEVERLRAIGPNSWTHAVVAHMDRADKAEAAIGRVRELVESADRASEESLSRVFGGHPFGASVPTPDLIRALDGETGEQS